MEPKLKAITRYGFKLSHGLKADLRWHRTELGAVVTQVDKESCGLRVSHVHQAFGKWYVIHTWLWEGSSYSWDEELPNKTNTKESEEMI